MFRLLFVKDNIDGGVRVDRADGGVVVGVGLRVVFLFFLIFLFLIFET